MSEGTRRSNGGSGDRVGGVRGGGSGDLGDLVIVLLAGTLAGLRDRLGGDGFEGAASLVADLVEATDDYLATIVPAKQATNGAPG